MAFLDNFLNIGSTKGKAEEDFKHTRLLLESLGFTVNLEKSQSEESTRMEFLGFLIDTIQMKFELPSAKAQEIRRRCRQIAHQSSVLVRQLAEVIRMLSATWLAVLPAPLNLLQPAVPEDSRSSPPPLIRIKSNSEQREQARLGVVGPQSEVQQWQTHQLPEATNGDRFRLGSLLL